MNSSHLNCAFKHKQNIILNGQALANNQDFQLSFQSGGIFFISACYEASNLGLTMALYFTLIMLSTLARINNYVT